MGSLSRNLGLMAAGCAIIAGVRTVQPAASSGCYMWESRSCCTMTSILRKCRFCGWYPVPFPVTNPGVRWICLTVEAGWPNCVSDTGCWYRAEGNCTQPNCGALNVFEEQGIRDQLIDGGDCP
jgi:hypothetical protein